MLHSSHSSDWPTSPHTVPTSDSMPLMRLRYSSGPPARSGFTVYLATRTAPGTRSLATDDPGQRTRETPSTPPAASFLGDPNHPGHPPPDKLTSETTKCYHVLHGAHRAP